MLRRPVEYALAATVAVKDKSCLAARMAFEPGHAQRIDNDLTRHVLAQRPAHHLATKQIDDHRQKKPALIGGYVRDVARPHLVRLGYGELSVQQVGGNR